MRRDHIAAALKPFLVPVEGKPHVVALVAPPTPRSLPLGDAGMANMLGNAAQAMGRLQGAMTHWQNPDLFTRTLARREAVQSSQIEGTQTELDQLLAYEITRNTDGMPPDVRITERYVQALQLGLDAVRREGRKALSLELIHRMHALLMRDEPETLFKGRYRTIQAWIGTSPRIEDARFVPSPPANIETCMRELERSMLQYAPREDEPIQLGVIMQVAIAHAQFETIHPYADGNGRVGRLLMPLILAAEHHPPLYLSGTLLRNRLGYYDALAQVQLQGNWSPWMALVARAVIESADDALTIAKDMQTIVDGWEHRIAGHRRDAVARHLPRLLVDHPLVSARQVAELLGVSLRSALTGIDTLVEYGILVPKDQRQWGRLFQADAVLKRLNQAP
jgi:Fic family protein